MDQLGSSLDLGKTLTLQEAAAALGVTDERVRQRVKKGLLSGAQNEAGRWEITVDARFLEIAEQARLKALDKAAKDAKANPAQKSPESEPNPAPIGFVLEDAAPEEPLFTASLEPPQTEPKRRGKASAELGGGSVRTDAITAKQVERGTVAAFGLVAAVRGRQYEHWRVDPSEVQPWSAEAAALLNSLPLAFVQAAASSSGAFVVGMGLFGIVYGRLAIDAEISRAQQAHGMRQAATDADAFLAAQRRFHEATAPGGSAPPEPGVVQTQPGAGAGGPVGPLQPHPVGGEFFTGL